MGNPAAAKEHVYWSIWHEGVPVFFTPDPNAQLTQYIRSTAEMRAAIMATQAHNGVARNLIAGLNDDELQQLILVAPAEISAMTFAHDTMSGHFHWVCYHEGYLPEFRQWNSDQNYAAIRAQYRSVQDHNPDARNLLAAVDNTWIKDLIDSY
ncbi:hypothetical protein [Burkholderia cepacia]|uniref:hypothetical protein n=1 Tax=Burkholderia cepacia TaxID=292 RepID=UPI00158CF2D1|nr:hypothetical protein [Burkholderia cepacia]MCA8160559.1 hypothetical protein [Burkholderia cepacia]